MASLIRRADSPYWRVAYRNPLTGKRVREATRYRCDDRMQTRKARELCAKRSYEEKSAGAVNQGDRWQVWVRGYLAGRYDPAGLTYSRYAGVWRTVEGFLIEYGFTVPSLVNHSAVMAYLDWRRDPEKQGRAIAPRTILIEIKVLGLVMDEAIRRGAALVNPCHRLGLSRKATREKPVISRDEEKMIRAALVDKPGWMRVSFDIAMAQGCRFKETRLPLSDIDVDRLKILFRAKGGKVFETALNPVLVPLIQKLKKGGQRLTWDLPPNELLQTSRSWTRFFRKIGLAHICFHSTRVTAITRAHMAGVSQAKAMRFFGHSSWSVHAIYTKLGTEDVSDVANALASFGLPVSGVSRSNPLPETEGSPPAKTRRASRSSASRTGKRSPRTSSPSRKGGKHP